jgi:hypothetical protein
MKFELTGTHDKDGNPYFAGQGALTPWGRAAAEEQRRLIWEYEHPVLEPDEARILNALGFPGGRRPDGQMLQDRKKVVERALAAERQAKKENAARNREAIALYESEKRTVVEQLVEQRVLLDQTEGWEARQMVRDQVAKLERSHDVLEDSIANLKRELKAG